MPARLKPSPLAAARDPLDALRLRGWALGGVRSLAGLLIDLASAPPGWPARLRPWLDGGAEVRRHGDLLLVLFAAPRDLDCAALGPCLGVVRQGGILAAAPFAEPEPALAARLRDHLVHVRAGAPAAVPLAAFAAVDVAGWWSLDGFEVVRGRAVPGAAASRRSRRTSAASVAPDPEPVFAAVRAAMARPPRRGLRAATGDLAFRFSGALWSAFAALRWLAVAAVALGMATTLLLQGWAVVALFEGAPTPPAPDGDSFPWFPFWLVVPILFAFRRARRGTAGPAGGSGGRAGAPAAAVRRPLWRRFGAWMAWHSPLGAAVRRRYAERVRDVERLFGAGRLDEALLKALKLGGPSAMPGAFGDLPLTGPGLREALALDLSGSRTAARPLLRQDDEERLRALYRLHAQALARAGDVDRGAFILAELLDAPAEAARLFADHGRFALAARLGEARRLAPAFVIPLWFKAGDAGRALTLAARHDLFAELWKELRPGDPFRGALAEAWCARLVDAGAFGRAAEVARGIEALDEPRRGWIRRALEAADPPPAAALARALVALPWMPDASDPLFDAFHRLLAEAGASGAARRLAVAAHLADRGFEPRRPAGMPAFRLATNGLARRLAVDEAEEGHLDRRSAAMAALAGEGGHLALRHDLRRLATVPRPKLAEPDRRVVFEAGPPLAALVDVVPVADGGLLVAYASGLLVLRGSGGRELWRGEVGGVLGLVPVGEGHRVLVLRHSYGEVLGAVLSVGERRLDPCGSLPVAAWHPHATETGWPVFTEDGAFALLDTACLLGAPDGAPPPLLHHWSIPMGEPGRAVAVLRDAREAALAYARDDGLLEWWTVDLRTLKVDCRFWPGPPGEPVPGDATEATFAGADPSPVSLGTSYTFRVAATPRPDGSAGAWMLHGQKHDLAPIDRAREREMLADLAARPPSQLGPVVALEGSGAWATRAVAGGVVWVGRPSPSGPEWTVEGRGSGSIRGRFSADGTTATVFDDAGRIALIDVAGQSWSLPTF